MTTKRGNTVLDGKNLIDAEGYLAENASEAPLDLIIYLITAYNGAVSEKKELKFKTYVLGGLALCLTALTGFLFWQGMQLHLALDTALAFCR